MLRHARRTFDHIPVPNLLPPFIKHQSFLWEVESLKLRGESLLQEGPEYILLYLHGGAYVAGRAYTYINMVGKICEDIKANAYLLDYRLAPEHPFPAGFQDAFAAYNFLLKNTQNSNKIILMGDSAGGGLALSLLLKIRDEKLPLPRCVVALSPVVDLTFQSKSIIENSESDDVLTAAFIHKAEGLYCKKEERENPYVSPIFGDLSNLVPILLTVSETECLRDDSLRFKQKATESSTKVNLIIRDDLPHVWPVFHPLLPEATEDLEKISQFILNLDNIHGRN